MGMNTETCRWWEPPSKLPAMGLHSYIGLSKKASWESVVFEWRHGGGKDVSKVDSLWRSICGLCSSPEAMVCLACWRNSKEDSNSQNKVERVRLLAEEAVWMCFVYFQGRKDSASWKLIWIGRERVDHCGWQAADTDEQNTELRRNNLVGACKQMKISSSSWPNGVNEECLNTKAVWRPRMWSPPWGLHGRTNLINTEARPSLLTDTHVQSKRRFLEW